MFAGDQGVVQKILVVIESGVLKVELDQLNSVGESKQRHFYSLSDRNRVCLRRLAPMRTPNCNRPQVSLEGRVTFNLPQGKATRLLIKEVRRVEHGLALVSAHLAKKESLKRLLHHAQRHSFVASVFDAF